ncbi:glycosyl transferase [Pseudorhizobium endolithicum]|uniref:Glycosyl transferase n=1 Tax=Pseudorhizobium endolithicum TaxID=1191678 RepID=A0ABM8PGG9_9HYPH|nr:transglycosylase SLT domain-containing protein [Pseudorhizobium endolithicum]CAD6422187.1 glycosyl transferase [Rhizobium sp. Q54]CAD7028514.1 glycosyl transferase [Pseudorhizobium endolithicum]
MKAGAVWLALLFFLLSSAAAPGEAASEAASSECLSSWSDASGGSLCIRRETFNRDLCAGIEYFALRQGIPADFFARLIWRESLFRPDAVSPKGAQGIAQFMPATARRRGLSDSFDILAALDASSAYLKELHDRFGGYGYAAAAYNAGEAGLQTFLDKGTLPFETRAYVTAITGRSIEGWASDPPPAAAAPLDPDKPFSEGCVALAESRRLPPGATVGEGKWAPWGVQVASHVNPEMARSLFAGRIASLPSPLNEELPVIVHQTRGNFGYRGRYAARIGRETRAEANDVCARIRAAGGTCTVLRN